MIEVHDSQAVRLIIILWCISFQLERGIAEVGLFGYEISLSPGRLFMGRV